MRGIHVTVYRGPHDCTNGGVTSPERDKLHFVLFDPALRTGNCRLEECLLRDGIVCLRLVRRSSIRGEYLHAVPMHEPEGKLGMFGGHFVYSSDSRFADLCQYPIPVHDRYE